MDNFLPIVKFLTIAQMLIVVLFLLLMYLTKFYNYLHHKKTLARAKLATNILDSNFKTKEDLTKKSIFLLKKSIQTVLKNLEMKEKREGSSEYFIAFKAKLSELVLKPLARKWTSSKIWYKRFNATLCYAYGFDPEDENNLFKLLNDPSLLIAMNAAKTIVEFNHRELINEIISTFSQGRRLQQSLAIESISKTNNDISSVILDRLQIEQDLYTKVFCYRLLSKFPQLTLAPCFKRDIAYDLVDLKIAILANLVLCEDNNKNELIFSLAKDPHWEIGAAAAKALGQIHEPRSFELLTEMLHSGDWWVRHNAAISLYQLGKQGIKILKSQSIDEDKFAYETAQAILIEKEN